MLADLKAGAGGSGAAVFEEDGCPLIRVDRK
jgi:hypothetical protein